MQLIPIEQDGSVSQLKAALPDVTRDVLTATARLYEKAGFEPPWIGYLAVEDGVCVGTCAFTGPPASGRVEIAYYTFPPHEGRGVATRMAQALISVSIATNATVLVTAHTLPEDNASTTVLKRLGFHFAGSVEHPEDGTVWEWHLLPPF